MTPTDQMGPAHEGSITRAGNAIMATSVERALARLLARNDVNVEALLARWIDELPEHVVHAAGDEVLLAGNAMGIRATMKEAITAAIDERHVAGSYDYLNYAARDIYCTRHAVRFQRTPEELKRTAALINTTLAGFANQRTAA